MVRARPSRGAIARYAAPAAFLAGVTIAVLLVRAGLQDDSGTPGRTTPARPAPAVAAPAETAGTGRPSELRGRYYRIRSGDTLGGVAERFRTTVEALLELNPGIEPTGLRVGQRIRVG